MFLVMTLAFKKTMGQVSAWKSGLKVPVQSLLSDLVGCGSMLQTVMTIWRIF